MWHTSDPTRDQLAGIYAHAALWQHFDVVFLRMQEGGMATSRLR